MHETCDLTESEYFALHNVDVIMQLLKGIANVTYL